MPIQAPQWTDFLSCPVCYNLFNEQYYRPISLGCGHTVCKSCLSKLHSKKCPFDQSAISRAIEELPVNYALLQLVGTAIPEKESITVSDLSEHCRSYESANRCIEHLAVYLKPFSAGAGNTNAILSRPMQRKLVALVNCQLIEEEGRARGMRAARSLSERTVTELILQHQNPQQLSANLWAAVRARGCQFLGPAMQEEVLKLILLALEDGSALSRKVLVLFVVQRLEPQYPQASKTAIGHVVQLLYRASCFKVTKRDEESSLMQLKEEFRTYETLRREHDAQIVQIATEAGLRISPDQWSSLLYGDTAHKSHMQSIIDKLQTPQSFGQSVNELVIALQRTGDPGNLSRLRPHFELLANIDPSPDAPIPSWENLEAVMQAVQTVVEGLVDFIQHHSHKKHEPANLHNTKYKTNMCRDLTQKGTCPRAANCTFAHSQDEMEKYRARNKKFGGKTGSSSVAGLTPKEKAELDQVTKSTRERMIAKSARQDSYNPMGIKHMSVKLNSSSDSATSDGSPPPPGPLSAICSPPPHCTTTTTFITATSTSYSSILAAAAAKNAAAGASSTSTATSSSSSSTLPAPSTPPTSPSPPSHHCRPVLGPTPPLPPPAAVLTSNTSTVSSVSYQTTAPLPYPPGAATPPVSVSHHHHHHHVLPHSAISSSGAPPPPPPPPPPGCILPCDMPPPGHVLDGGYYKPAAYCIPTCHQRMPGPHPPPPPPPLPPQYLFNYRVDQGVPHMQYHASTISMLDIHSLPVAASATSPYAADPWKKTMSAVKENSVQQRIVPTSGPFPDHSGWEQPVPSNTISQSKSLEDLLDRRLEILNIVQRKEMSPMEVPTTGAPCTPVTNAPAIYQGNHRMNLSVMDVSDIGGVEPKMFTSSSLTTTSKSYVSTSTTPSVSYRTSCGTFNKTTSSAAETNYVSWSCGDSSNNTATTATATPHPPAQHGRDVNSHHPHPHHHPHNNNNNHHHLNTSTPAIIYPHHHPPPPQPPPPLQTQPPPPPPLHGGDVGSHHPHPHHHPHLYHHSNNNNNNTATTIYPHVPTSPRPAIIYPASQSAPTQLGAVDVGHHINNNNNNAPAGAPPPHTVIYPSQSPHHNLTNCPPPPVPPPAPPPPPPPSQQQNCVGVEPSRPNKTSAKDQSSVFNIFGNIDYQKKDPYDDSREDFARHSHGGENDDFIPFDPPIVSKFGPISRTKVKDKATCPVQVTAEGNTSQVIPVTASTPYEHNYMVSSSLAPSSYKNIVITDHHHNHSSQLRPDAKPFVSSTLPELTDSSEEISNSSGEPYTLWNVQDSLLDKSNSKIKKELSQLAQQSQIASTDGEKLDLELKTINLQITLKMKSLHMALEAQLKESNLLNEKKRQEQQDRQYAEDLVIEELVQKVKDSNIDGYIGDPDAGHELTES